MASETAMGVAARIWTEPETEQEIMNVPIALAFAEKVDSYHNLIELAWGIIANAGSGDWTKETLDWQQAAIRWRESYHAMLNQDLAKA